MDIGTLDAAHFIAGAGAVAQSVDHLFVFDTDTGKLYFDADGSGAGVAVLILELQGINMLNATDIVIA